MSLHYLAQQPHEQLYEWLEPSAGYLIKENGDSSGCCFSEMMCSHVGIVSRQRPLLPA